MNTKKTSKRLFQSILGFYRSPSGLLLGALFLVLCVGLWTNKIVVTVSLVFFAVALPYRLMREQQRSDEHDETIRRWTYGQVSALDALNASLGNQVKGLEASLGNRVKGLEASLGNRVKGLELQLNELSSHQALSESRQSGLFGEYPQPFSRFLDKTVTANLVNVWDHALNLNHTLNHVEWLSLHLQDRERASLGRFATTLADMVSRVLITRSALDRNTQILEIGTLFGLGSLLVHEAVRPFCDSLQTTVIDPFEGYYDRGRFDPPTGMPVTEATFITNRQILGIDESEIRLLKGLSNDKSIFEAASDRQYQVIVVDGDHSYQGVKDDVERYTPLLADDGLLIIDDYGTDDWPDIYRYVNELVDSGQYELLGHYSRTAAICPKRD